MIKLPQYQPRLATAGHIKNGINVAVMDSQTGRQKVAYDKPVFRPQQLDHFLITTLVKDETGNFVVDRKIMNSLLKEAGEKSFEDGGLLRKLPILVNSDDFNKFMPTELAAREGRTVFCRGDGEKARRWKVDRGHRAGTPIEMKCPCSHLTDGSGKCKPSLTLRCKLATSEAVTIGSVYDYWTSSVIGVPNLLGGFAEIQSMIGTLIWVPLWLELRADKVQPQGYEKTVHSAFVHLRGSDIKQIQERAISMVNAAQQVQKIAGRELMLPLPPAPLDDDDDEQDLLGEFYPDALETTVVDSKGAPVGTTSAAKPAKSESATAKPAAAEASSVAAPSSATVPEAAADTAAAQPAAKAEAMSGADKPAAADSDAAPASAPAKAEPMGQDDPLRARIVADLTILAELRGTEPRFMKIARKEILAQITAELCGDPISYAALTVSHGVKIAQALSVQIATLKAKAEAPHDDAIPAPSDDDIPE